MAAGCRRRCEMPSPGKLSVEVLVDERVALPAGLSEASLSSLARHVLGEEGETGDWQIGVLLIDDASMQQAHLEFMGIDSPTDIMTFPYEEVSFDDLAGLTDVSDIRGGDLMISVERAADHARDAGWSTADELRFLLIHGILHLLGWDDQTDDDRARMLERQAALLESWSAG